MNDENCYCCVGNTAVHGMENPSKLLLYGLAQIGVSTGRTKLEVRACSVALSCYWDALALWCMLYELPLTTHHSPLSAFRQTDAVIVKFTQLRRYMNSRICNRWS
jgi:hypothetical protein